MDELVDVLMLRPEAIHVSPHRGEQERMKWGELVGLGAHPCVTPAKDAHGGLSLGAFREGVRRLACFERTIAMGLDHDAGEVSPQEAFAACAPWRRVVYTTFSHRPEHPKWRAIFMLDRAVDAGAFKRAMRALQTLFLRAGVTLDRTAVDASRWWFMPCVARERIADHACLATGADAPALPVDRLLAHAEDLDAAEQARREAYRRAHPAPELDNATVRDRYLRGALVKAAAHVASAVEGERHAALNSEAFGLARLGIDEGTIEATLVAPFVAAAGEAREREARRTVRDAVRARERGAA